MSGFGSCGTGGSGTSNLVSPKYITSGSQTIDPARELSEDGTPKLNEDGGYRLLEGVVTGNATPLIRVATACQYVVVAAQSTNTGTIWISGSDVAVGTGIPLYANGDSILIPIDDVSKVYILGLGGEGVTFFYGTVALPGDLTFLGSPLTFGGDPLSA